MLPGYGEMLPLVSKCFLGTHSFVLARSQIMTESIDVDVVMGGLVFVWASLCSRYALCG